MNMSRELTPAQKLLGDFAPTLVNLTDRVLFGEVWEHTGLSKRDRSLVTVAALVAMNRPDQLRFHLKYAVENGIKKRRIDRRHYAPGVLCRLAQRHERHHDRQRTFFVKPVRAD